jgi:hypothetical protein
VQRRRGAIKEEETRQAAKTPRDETRIVEDSSLGALAAWRLSSLVSLARISLTLH